MDSQPSCQSSASDDSYLCIMPAQKKKPIVRKPRIKPIAQQEMREWINTLQVLMESEMIDSEKTLPGGEPVMKSFWTEEEIYSIKGRIFYILDFIPTK